MWTFRLSTLIFVIGLFSCRGSQESKEFNKSNDTSEVFRIMLDSAFNGKSSFFKPIFYRNNPFKDSIIFVQDNLIIDAFPIVSGLKFKMLSKDSICELATQTQSDSTRFPQILEVPVFRKTEEGFDIILENNCVIPLYNSNGKIKNPSSSDSVSINKCWYKFFCGSSIFMSLIKRNDSIICKDIRFGAD